VAAVGQDVEHGKARSGDPQAPRPEQFLP
jgi:hypothetical protein